MSIPIETLRAVVRAAGIDPDQCTAFTVTPEAVTFRVVVPITFAPDAYLTGVGLPTEPVVVPVDYWDKP